jgi:hypothetical protein
MIYNNFNSSQKTIIILKVYHEFLNAGLGFKNN